MKTLKTKDPEQSLVAKIIIAALLFFGAFTLDSLFEALSVYPLYLAAILFTGVNISFFLAIPLSMLAAYTSLHTQVVNLESVNIFIARTILLVTIAFLFTSYLGIIKTYRTRFELLKRLIPQCPDCGAVLCNDGEWRSIERLSGRPDLIGTNHLHDCRLKT